MKEIRQDAPRNSTMPLHGKETSRMSTKIMGDVAKMDPIKVMKQATMTAPRSRLAMMEATS